MLRARRATTIGLVSVVVLATLSGVGAPVRAAAADPVAVPVPVPVVEGPIPSDLDAEGNDRTFFASDLGLPGRGYVEEEFFYSGTANVYDATVAGGIGARPTPSPTANVVSSGHDYKTRMVVRRPANPRDFNGAVVVEWLNATSNYDVEAMWFRTHEHLMRDGYAWVGITAQSGPIGHPTLGLKKFSPKRYSSLDLTDGGTITSGDPLSFDAYAQGVQAVREAGVLGPLQSEVDTVLGAGVSQSAGRLSVYLNAIHTRTEPVLDAALLYIGGERVRDDLDVPVLKLLSETEYAAPASANEISSLQPDSDRMRTWSMAGTSHSDWASFAVRYALLGRDQPAAPLQDTCARPSRSRVPDRYVISAATEQLVDWAEGNGAPVTSDRIALAEDGVTVLRDERGNALGGIRLAPFAVPTALSTGINENAPGAGGLCFLNGTHIPFDAETLNALYPTRSAYLEAFDAAVAQNVVDGFVLPEDADEMRADARATVVGLGLKCAELCANVDQFPRRPSTQLLRDHTAFLYVRGGAGLLDLVDEATLAVARAQSEPSRAANHRARAAEALTTYQRRLVQLRGLGRVTEEQAALLHGYAQVLITALDVAQPRVTVTASRARQRYGARPADRVMLSAEIETAAGDGPAGTVTFTDAGRVLAEVPVRAGRADLRLPARLDVGRRIVTASFEPEGAGAAVSAAVSATVSVRVLKARARVEVRTTPANPKAGTRARSTVSVRARGAMVTGSVQIAIRGPGPDHVVRAPVREKRAVVRLPRLEAGTYRVIAAYLGSPTVQGRVDRERLVVG